MDGNRALDKGEQAKMMNELNEQKVRSLGLSKALCGVVGLMEDR